MASERIVSAGVYTQENDQTPQQQGNVNAGAMIIGPTSKGQAFVPTLIRGGFNEFTALFGESIVNTYVPYTVKYYLENASSVMVTRVLGNGGWQFGTSAGAGLFALIASGSATTSRVVTVFHPSKNATALELGLSRISGTNSMTGSFNLVLSGSGFTVGRGYTASLVKNNTNYIARSVGTSADNSLSGSSYEKTGFPWLNFKTYQSSSATLALTASLSNVAMFFTASIDGTIYPEGYTSGMSPMITDGDPINPKELFRFVHLSHGLSTNSDVYVSITGLQEPADINGVEQYSLFTVLVRNVGDTDKQPSIVEQYTNVNLDPNSPNFIARAIGDKYYEYDTNVSKLMKRGNYPNISKYIRVSMGNSFNADLSLSSLSPRVSPRGFKAIYDPTPGFPCTGGPFYLPSASLTTVQTIDGFYNSKAYLGFNWREPDNFNFLNPIASSTSVTGAQTTGNNANFTVNTLSGHASASWVGSLSASVDLGGTSGPLPSQVQFSVPFQGGSDGLSFGSLVYMGSDMTATNSMGFDLSAIGTAGGKGYKKALDIIRNTDDYDINLLALPGVLHTLAPAITSYAIDVVEDREDTLYVMDNSKLNDSITQALASLSSNPIDSSYTSTYYPWVSVANSDNNGRPVWVPPSVVVLGVYANNDSLGAEWYAPAGLNRAGLSMVTEMRNKLEKNERDVLYEGRVNPIATFPGQGSVVWGQKTLQLKASALDRIGVRRLLINLKKYISGVSRYLVFEQNTAVTRNKFLGMVTPYLESVQQKQGLYSFRVTMDETNNTADVIDRNQLVGAIYLQPTRTAEFIILDFNILPTGATFA